MKIDLKSRKANLNFCHKLLEYGKVFIDSVNSNSYNDSIGTVATTENVTPTNSLKLDAESTMAVSYDPTRPQVCPMCEATFPAVDFTQEVFLDHVNSHFTCEEEPDTLHNYEVVNADAAIMPSS